MVDLMIEILGYIVAASAIGVLLGWLVWGWGQRDRIAAARAEGARGARTSVDGDSGAKAKLMASAAERAVLEAEIDRLTERLAAAELATGLGAADDPFALDDDDAALDDLDLPDDTADGEAGEASHAVDVVDDAGDAMRDRGPGAGQGAPVSVSTEAAVAGRSADGGPAEPTTRIPLPEPAALASDAGAADTPAGLPAATSPGAETRVELPASPPGAEQGADEPGPAEEAGAQPPADARDRRAMLRAVPTGDALFGEAPSGVLPTPAPAAGPPDVTLRRRIMADPNAKDRPPSAPDDASTDGSDMPHPPAFTLRRQRAASTADPASDESAGRSSAFDRRRDRPTRAEAPDLYNPPQRSADPVGDSVAASPQRPSIFALRRQRVSRADDPPIGGLDGALDGTADTAPDRAPAAVPGRAAQAPSDQHAPTPTGPGAPDPATMPRPAASTLRHQRLSGNGDENAGGEPPVVDEQVPPDGARGEDDAGPAMPRPDAPDGAASTPRSAVKSASGPGAPPHAPASLLGERPAAPDDLRRIKGVGKVTERLLNQNGIWLYRQIAGLAPAERAWLAATVGVPEGRLDRDDWIGQARALDRAARDAGEDDGRGGDG